MYYLSNICFMCLTDDNNLKKVFCKHSDNDNDTVNQVKYVLPNLPELANLQSKIPLHICSSCQISLNSSYTFMKMCLENCNRLKQYITILHGSLNTQDHKFSELQTKINKTKLQTNRNTGSDVNVKQVKQEQSIIKQKVDINMTIKKENEDSLLSSNEEDQEIDLADTIICKEECLVSDDNTDQEFYQQVVKSELESNSITSVMNQLKKKKKRNKNVDCAICNRKLANKGSFKLHMKMHAGIKDHECPICHKMFLNKGYLQVHIKFHKGIKDYECSICKQKFVHRGNMKIHMKTNHENVKKEYECPICNKQFLIESYLKLHLKLHKEIDDNECSVCHKKFTLRSSLTQHMKTIHLGIKEIECAICNKRFARKTGLRAHLKKHIALGDRRTFECSICHKMYASDRNLQNHVKIGHLGIRDTECTICNRKFTQRGYLRQHMKIHEGIKDIECDICEKKFTQKSYLKIHMRFHDGIKDYKCTICTQLFSVKSSLNKHLRNVHTVHTKFYLR